MYALIYLLHKICLEEVTRNYKYLLPTWKAQGEWRTRVGGKEALLLTVKLSVLFALNVYYLIKSKIK